MKNKKKLIVLLIALAAMLCSWYFYTHREVDIKDVTLFGNVEIRQVDLSFQVAGKIEKMLKEEGDNVIAGELLAVMDERDYHAALEKSIADSSSMKASKNEAFSRYERQFPLCSDNTVSKQDCDTLVNLKEAAQASYQGALAKQKEAQNKFDYTKVYAPEDGIVTTRVQEPGANVTVGQPIYTISKDKPIWIRAFIPESQLGNIKYGMKATVLTDSTDPKTGKKREYTGWIGYISPVAEFTPKTVQTEDLRTDLVYRIRVYVYDVDKYLRQGMPTTVKIKLNEMETRKIVK